MRVIAAFSGPCASDDLTSRVSVFSHDFKSLERFPKLATSSHYTAHDKRVTVHLQRQLPWDGVRRYACLLWLSRHTCAPWAGEPLTPLYDPA